VGGAGRGGVVSRWGCRGGGRVGGCGHEVTQGAANAAKRQAGLERVRGGRSMSVIGGKGRGVEAGGGVSGRWWGGWRGDFRWGRCAGVRSWSSVRVGDPL
jgi:hypothetical protein